MKRYIFTPACPDELFTDREEEMELLWQMGIDTEKRWTRSAVLIGLRRLGKTELFKRVHSKLFFEQDKVVPIFFSYEGAILNSKEFTERYFLNFIRQYLAFTTGKDLSYLQKDLDKLIEAAYEKKDAGLIYVIEFFLNLRNNKDELLEIAINAPRTVADYNERPIIVFLDEFQDVLKIKTSDGINSNALGKHQNAVESRWCPHIITGSAMTLILKDIVERGPLHGRFRIEYIRGMSAMYAADLAKKLAAVNGVSISTEMAVHLGERTGGNPVYIWAILDQARLQKIDLNLPNELNEAVATDLIKGGIYSELSQQIRKFVYEQNRWGAGKEIIYYIAELEDEPIRITTEDMIELSKRLRHSRLTPEVIREMFIDLARADLVEEFIFGEVYGKINDPILNEFLRAWKRMEKEKKPQNEMLNLKLTEYRKKVKHADEYKGYVAERMIELLMLKWREEIVDGEPYFGLKKEIFLPRFIWVGERKLRSPEGRQVQIDVVGAYLEVGWFVESKYWQGQKVDLAEIKEFEERCRIAGKSL
ncbi:MAG: ATP-binding protein, partial [bacterium]|nr:ATP-binding protein [bacterium]